jgi:hypothetical protein
LIASAPSFLPRIYIGHVTVALLAYKILAPLAMTLASVGSTQYLKLTSG